ncbi:MAG: hypothetical protein KatS3mg014_0181 [Actinomycetota bacterium]|nr:MAG: hypothetical protein KatS3mg014_0181 [Actinomycetota bacterium]
MALVDVAREADDHAAGVRAASRGRRGPRTPGRSRSPPLSSTVAASASIVGRLLDEPEVVAEPLHEGAGDGDRALQAVHGRLVADLVAEGRQQAALGGHRVRARVEQHEAARCRRCSSPRPASSRSARTGPPAGRRDRRRPAPRRARRRPSRRPRSEGRIAGSIARGIPMRSRISSSQSRVSRFMSIVRLAFETSVTWTPPSGPPVRFQMHQVSMLPNSSSPFSARRPGPLDVVEDPLDLRPREVRRQGQAGLRPEPVLAAVAGEVVADLGRCGCPARRSRCRRASPVARSHTTVVSRWFVTPTAAMSLGRTPAFSSAPLDHLLRSGSRSPSDRARPSPAWGRSARAPSGRSRPHLPPWSKIMNRVLVVPWSKAAAYFGHGRLLLSTALRRSPRHPVPQRPPPRPPSSIDGRP